MHDETTKTLDPRIHRPETGHPSPVPGRFSRDEAAGQAMTEGADSPSTRVPGFGFGEALRLLERGRHVTRLGWNGNGQFLTLQRPDLNSKMTRPYIYITTVDGGRVPWLASQSDMLGNDWREVVENRYMAVAPLGADRDF